MTSAMVPVLVTLLGLGEPVAPVEQGLKSAANAAPARPPRMDASKMARETPVEGLLEGAAPARDTGPEVAPGAVHWHADLARAQEAARASGRPVLLFQLLGKLDDAFC